MDYSKYIQDFTRRTHAVVEYQTKESNLYFFPELLVNDAHSEIYISVEKRRRSTVEKNKRGRESYDLSWVLAALLANTPRGVKMHLRTYAEDNSERMDAAEILISGDPKRAISLGAATFPQRSDRRKGFVTRRAASISLVDFQAITKEKTICIKEGAEMTKLALSCDQAKLMLFLASVFGWDQLTETSRSVLVPLFEREIQKDQKEEEERNIKTKQENEKKARLIPEIARLLMKEMFEDRSHHELEYVYYGLSDLETAFKKVIEREHIQVNFDWVNSISVVDISHFLQRRFYPWWHESDLYNKLYAVRFKAGYLSSQQFDDAWEGKISPGDLTLMNEMGYLIKRHLDHDGKLESLYDSYTCEKLEKMGLVHCYMSSVVCEVTDYEQACELISCGANKREEFLEERKKNKEKKEQRGAKVEKVGCLIEIISVLISFIIGWDIDGINPLIFLIVIPIITAIARRIIAYIIRRR